MFVSPGLVIASTLASGAGAGGDGVPPGFEAVTQDAVVVTQDDEPVYVEE